MVTGHQGSLGMGWVVADKVPGQPWSIEHSGHTWQTWEEAAAERDECLRDNASGRQYAVARVMLDDSRGAA